MEAALAAARLGDGIEHSSAMLGFVVGAVAGLAVGVAMLGAIVAAPFTGGLSLCAGVAAVAALGGIVAGTGAGALAGATLGGLATSAAGPIVTGSANVLVNRKPAARAVADTVQCTKHSSPPKRIAQGSQTVGINNKPAARKTDKTECDGTIAEGSPNVFIGAEAGTFLPISGEVPAWAMDTAKWMMIIGGGVALGAGLLGAALGGLAAVGAFVGNIAMGAALSFAGKEIGGTIGEALWGEKGRIAGETLGEMAGIPGARNALRSLRGHPIDVASGELVIEQADFALPGPLPITWARRWSSGSALDGELGYGWSHPFDMALEVLAREGLAKVRLEDGRLAFFPLPTPDGPAVNLPERLALMVEGEGYRLQGYDGTAFHLSPGAGGLHRLSAVSDPAGNAVRLSRGVDGRLEALEDSGGRLITMAHDAAGRIVAIDGPHPTQAGARARLVSYAYGHEGDLAAATDPRGGQTSYRAANHLIVEERRRSGLTFHFRWDDLARGRGARCKETWGDNRLFYCRFDYLPDEQATVVTDHDGGATFYRYDRNGQVVSERDPLGHEQAWRWSELGALLSYRDGSGRTSSYAYDAYNRMVRQASPDGAAIDTTYAPVVGADDLASPRFGLPNSATLPGGGLRTYGYDARGMVSTISTPMGREVRLLRDGRGLPVAIGDQMGTFRRMGWDGAGQLSWQDGGTGADAVRYAYDALGRVSSVADAAEHTDYIRDPSGNPTGIRRRGDGAAVALAYDEEDRVTLHRDGRGRETRWAFAGLPSPISRTGADGATVRYEYDRALALVGIRNAKDERYAIERDANGRAVRETGFDGRLVEYRYDAGGLVVERRGADGSTRYDRDAAGQVVRQRYPDGREHRFHWDANGRLAGTDTPDRSVALRYDADGRVAEEVQDGLVLAHAYDLRGARTETRLPDGRTIAVAHEGGGFASVAVDGREIVRVARDAAGREVERHAGLVEVRTEYDRDGRLVHQSARVAQGSRGGPHAGAVLDRRYHYDPYGQLLALEDLARGTKRYRYDAAERLVGVDGATPEAFHADPAGNLLPMGTGGAQGAVEGDRLLVWGDRRFEYDAEGRRLREWRGAGKGSEVRYAYNGAGQLAEVVERSRRGTRTTRYGYDGLGRRAWKEASVAPLRAANAEAEPAASVTRTLFHWDGDVLLAEASGSGGAAPPDALATVYLHEPGSFRPLAQLVRASADAAASVHHYHLDALGTPQELTNDNGAVTWRADLKAWGSVARQAEAAVANPIRFQGQYADAETGLHYNRFRYYDPVVARYINPDPIGLAGGLNAYAYVPDPTTWVDPLGLTACDFDWKALRLREATTGRFHPFRPDPKTYMSAAEIDAHLTPFRGGAAKIVKFNPTGTIGPQTSHFDKGVFVMTRADADAVIARTGGDPRLMEKELGLNVGDLGDKPNLISIDDPAGLRMPSGNETGANRHWIRGGYTSGGVREAVVDPIDPSRYRVTPITKGP